MRVFDLSYDRAMDIDAALAAVVACPRCDRALACDDGLRCPGCRLDFPLLDDVPFLFADPAHAASEWRERWHRAIRALEHDADAAKKAADATGTAPLAKTRLANIEKACRAHVAEIDSILAPLGVADLTADLATHMALRTRLPSDQGLTSYYANLHRDWSWGEEENAQSLALVTAGLDDHEVNRAVVLGAGGARLAYDLHRQIGNALTVAIDFNPLLVLAAARLVRGEHLPLHEFPIAPRSIDDVAIAQTLHAPETVPAGFHLLLANASRAPLRRGAFDTLITPWLVDILPETLEVQAARYNGLLEKGGRWVWFGSHAFRHASPAANVSVEESLDIIAAAGFDTPSVEESVIPYLSSPADRQARRERVVVIVANKTAATSRPPRHVALPDWLVTGKLPVPASDDIRTQAAATRIHAFVLALIDGKRSIDDMAALLEAQRLMPRDEAISTLRNFLIRVYEDSTAYRAL